MYSSSDQDQPQIFQQDEVLWAKIRGFPWWPAFVGKVHNYPKTSQTEYTVYFFGDNSHAKLGSLKLRKFIDFYTEFYPKAKTNRKLWHSIQKAEQNLAENEQDITIFEEMRKQMKKTTRNTVLQRKSSVKSEPPKKREEKKLTLSKKILIQAKSKTNNFKIEQQQSLNAEQQKQQSQEIDSSKLLKSKKKRALTTNEKQGPIDVQLEIKVQKPILSDENQIIVNSQSKSKLEFSNNAFQSQNIDELNNEEQRSESGSQNLQYSSLTAKAKSSKRIQKLNFKDNKIASSIRRKRGRPRKNINALSPNQSAFNTQGVYKIKRKSIARPVSLERQQFNVQLEPLSHAEILQKIPELLENRTQLIDFLLRVDITHLNAKQVLDLNVAEILQNGKSNSKVQSLIELLQSALLYRYFPGDLKNKKRYSKLIRKRGTNLKELSDERSGDGNFLKEIRKKTIVKLQKFLKGYAQYKNKAKYTAFRIEECFYKSDNSVGQRYRKTAYEILSILKQKNEQIGNIMKRLEANLDDA